MSIETRLVEVFKKVLGDDCEAHIVPGASMDDVPNWDSLNFVDVIFGVEKEFGVKIPATQAMKFFSIDAIDAFVREHAK